MSVPPALVPESFASRLYDALEPLAADDDANGWALLIYANAIGTMFQIVEELVRDSDDGPGWSLLLDLDRCPPAALPWLGQFVGVRMRTGATDAEQRNTISGHSGWERGTPAAIKSAAAATLTGSKTVVLRERDGDPYYLTVVTYTDQTPDSAATRAALLAQKPGGIVLTYRTAAGQDYQSLRDGHATYLVVKTTYHDYFGVLVDEPA